jgi:hypothetical protein
MKGLRKAALWTVLAALGAMTVAVAAQAAEEDKPGVDVTVYNQNFAVIKDRRMMEMPKGVGVVRFTDVASTIDATSVHFMSLTDPKAQVLEQNYEFDLVSADKLLQKYIDREITVFTKDEKEHKGILMSFDPRQIVLAANREQGPISMVERGDNVKRIQFSSLPEGLLTRPTLVWEVASDKGGQQLTKLTYVANNMSWRADYSLVVDKADKLVDLSGWVTINNGTGTGYADAAIKLLAGDTGGRARMRGQTMAWGPEYFKGLSKLAPTAKVGKEVGRAFGEYYLYKLNEKSTINNNQVKQIELLNAQKVPVKKIYLYDGSKVWWNPGQLYIDKGYTGEANKKVNVLLTFENRAETGMGFSLPAGKVRVYKKDTDGSLEFIGEDAIDHTPRDEKVTLYIGDAFDIVGERKQTNFQKPTDRTIIEDFEIKVRNHKEEAVTVEVLEKLYRAVNWEITRKSHDFKPLDSNTIEFPVDIPKDGEVTITYTVKYTW